MPGVAALSCLVALFIPFCSCAASTWPPPNNGAFDDISNEIFPNVGAPWHALATVDWDNDNHNDLLVAAANRTQLVILLWQESNHSFSPGPTFAIPASNNSDRRVVNAATADLDRDGQNDLAVLLETGEVYLVNGRYPDTGSTFLFPEGGERLLPIPQLSLLDIFGGCGLHDIVGVTLAGGLFIAKNMAWSSGSCDYLGNGLAFKPLVVDPNATVVPLSVLSNDIDGDCQVDMIYAASQGGQTIQYRMVNRNDLSKSLPLFTVPSYVGPPTAMDVNADGVLDMVFPTCTTPVEWSCNNTFDAIAYVLTLPSSAPCDGSACCLGFTPSYAPWALFRLEDQQGCVANISSSNAAAYPAVLRTNDYDRDSFTDLVVPTTRGPFLMHRSNGAALPPFFSCAPLDGRLSDSGGAESDSYRRSVPFFFDVNGDSRIDVLWTSPYGGAGTGSTWQNLGAYWNGLDMSEQYFFSATMLNGVQGGELASYPAWGATQLGAVHQFQWQDINTNVRTQTAVQQGKTQAHALEMQRSHFGIGKTFGYIQSYSVGVRLSNSADGRGSNTWSAYLVPNSQVVCYGAPINDPPLWVIRLFLSPTKFQMLLIVSMAVALTVIRVPIMILKWNEVKEDRMKLLMR